jgi:hypothetical protein
MANTNKPNGLTPHNSKASGLYNAATVAYPIAYNYGTAIYTGDPVVLASGKINLAGNTAAVIGVFAGLVLPMPTAAFTMPANWPAGGFATLGNQDVQGMVYANPNDVFEAQFGGSGSVTISNVGSYYKTGAGSPDTVSGRSGVYMDVGTVNTAISGLVWQFLGFVPSPWNDITSAYSRGLFVAAAHTLARNVAAA